MNSASRHPCPKLCECGCGEPVPIAKRTITRLAHVIGQPIRFISGHNTRVMPAPNGRGISVVRHNGYVRCVWFIARRQIAVFEHVLVAEKVLGKPMPAGACVHHVNEIRSDNRHRNLVICGHAYHQLLHARLRALNACGNPNWRKCVICKQWDDLIALDARRSFSTARQIVTTTYSHTQCLRTYSHSKYIARRSANQTVAA